jgi:hypothetical protein
MGKLENMCYNKIYRIPNFIHSKGMMAPTLLSVCGAIAAHRDRFEAAAFMETTHPRD